MSLKTVAWIFLIAFNVLGIRPDCPPDYSEHPLLIVSMDGFRYDYIPWAPTPRLDEFKQSGVYSPFMKASFPTITFPNHYAIVSVRISFPVLNGHHSVFFNNEEENL